MSNVTLTQDDVKKLCAEFPKDGVSVKANSFSRDKTKVLLVLYLAHYDVMSRLDEVDPAWSTTVLHEDRIGEEFVVRMKLTLKGVSRENVGEGADPKFAYSDALKRCAMLFGCGRYLYDSENVWVPYDDSRDKYRTWTMTDYEAGLNRSHGRTPSQGAQPQRTTQPSASAAAPKPNTESPVKPLGQAAPQQAAPAQPSGNQAQVQAGPVKSEVVMNVEAWKKKFLDTLSIRANVGWNKDTLRQFFKKRYGKEKVAELTEIQRKEAHEMLTLYVFDFAMTK